MLLDLPIPLAKVVLHKLATEATSSVLDISGKKTEQGAVRTGRGFTLFISNEDMDDITKRVVSLVKSGLLIIHGASETVKHKIKNPRRWISSCYDGT